MNSIGLAILAGVSWGIGEAFTRSVLHSGKIGPLTAIAIRSTVALPLIWLAWYAANRGWAGLRAEPNPLQADGPTLAKLILGSGVVAGAVAMISFYAALSMGELSRIKPIAFSLAPACAVMIAWLMMGEPMSVRKGLGVLLILTGVVILTGGSTRASGNGVVPGATPGVASEDSMHRKP